MSKSKSPTPPCSKGGDKPAAKTVEKCPLKEEPHIVKIEWLDGADDKVAASGSQWVNLPRNAKWVDATNGPKNIDRLSAKPRYKVTFNKPGKHSFKVKAAAGGNNVAYTGPEKGRNAKFKWLQDEKSYKTDGDGTKIVAADFFTDCAGMDTFKLAATDAKGTSVETGFLENKRLVYLVVIKMTGMTTNAALGTFKSEYAKHGIDVVELPAVEIDRIANIGPSEENTYKQKCKDGFNGSTGKDKIPYAVAMGFTEHLAVKNPNQLLELPSVQVGPGKPAVEIPVMTTGLRSGDGLAARSLWKNLVPGEGWFVSASFTPTGGTAQAIAEDKCTPATASASCRKVKVDVTGLAEATGTLKVTVNVVDRMRGGLSFPGGNLICICTKAWWTDQGSGVQNSTAVHEMGHKIGMVTEGTGKQPDKVETQYLNKGHVGSHCYYDLGVLDTYASSTGAQCVMFGAVSDTSPTAFCPKCTPAVRKVDLSDGWTV